jgi:hypothetical protein
LSWALATARERRVRRESSAMEEIEAFYDAMLSREWMRFCPFWIKFHWRISQQTSAGFFISPSRWPRSLQPCRCMANRPLKGSTHRGSSRLVFALT